jgi:hypothetical protein
MSDYKLMRNMHNALENMVLLNRRLLAECDPGEKRTFDRHMLNIAEGVLLEATS